jgi:predicted esterase
VKAIAPIDEHRVYLFGHSAGARYGLILGLLESEYFAAVAVHAGALQPDDKNTLLKLATRKTPFAIIVGKNDSLFPLPVVRATRDMLKSDGFAVELTEIPNHDHNYYILSKPINDTVWTFLKPRSLDTPQKFIVYASKGN